MDEQIKSLILESSHGDVEEEDMMTYNVNCSIYFLK